MLYNKCMSIFNKSIENKFLDTAKFLKKFRLGLPVNKQISSIRKFLGMSQSALSKRTNSTQPFLANVESGNQNISLGQLEKIANGLQCDLHIHLTPRKPLGQIKADQIEKQVKRLLNASLSNMILEDEKPSPESIEEAEEILRSDFSKRKKGLWND